MLLFVVLQVKVVLAYLFFMKGEKVSIKDDSMKEWKEIRLEDGKVGWVPASAIEAI